MSVLELGKKYIIYQTTSNGSITIAESKNNNKNLARAFRGRWGRRRPVSQRPLNSYHKSIVPGQRRLFFWNITYENFAESRRPRMPTFHKCVMVTFILEMGQNKNYLSKTSFDHNDLEKLFFVSTVQLQQHQKIVLSTWIRPMNVYFRLIHLPFEDMTLLWNG